MERLAGQSTEEASSPVSSLANSVVVGRAIDNLGDKLHVKVNKVTREQMPKGHRNEKGYFNPRTKEVFVCTDNVASVDDAIATVMHEAVAHLGLRRLLGDQFPETMRRIYEALDPETRRRVNALMSEKGYDAITAMEEYMAGLAEKTDFNEREKNLWEKIKDIFQNVLAVLTGRKTNLTDNDLRYILRASYENLMNPRYMETVQGWAKDMAMKSDLKVNDYVEPEYLFRAPTFEAGSNSVKNYEEALAERWQVIQMEHQDAQQAVRIGINAVQAETGNKPIEEDEDYIAKENLASSIAQTEQDEFLLFQVNPILEAVRRIQRILHGSEKMTAREQKAAYNEIITYLYAKHGAERNRYSNDELARQEAEADAAMMAAEGRHLNKAERKKYEPKDWSGLTSLFGLEKTEHEEAERLADELATKFEGRVGQAEVDTLWDSIRAATDYNLKHALDHGLLTRAEYDRLHGNESAGIPRMWEHYIPLRGFKEDTAEDRYDYSNITHQQANSVVVKKYKGRTTLAEDPIANLVNIGETEIAQGNSNLAKIALYKFALNRSGNKLLTPRDVWYEKQANGKWMAVDPLPGESLEDFEDRMQEERKNGMARIGRRGLKLDMIMANPGHKAEHLIRLKINGNEKAIWVNGNPALARAVAGSLRAQNMKALRSATRALSNLFTSYSIDFTARNLFRDMLYSRMRLMALNDPKYAAQYRKNWWNNFGYSPLNVPMVRLISQWQSGKLQQKANPTERERLFMDFMRDGGATGYTITNSVDRIKKDIMRQIANGGRGERSTVSKVLGFYPRAVQSLNEAYELLTRFTAYETSRQMGRSGQTSASDAKEISVNFNRKGAQTGKGFWGVTAAFMGATHYFYNAGVQGFQNFTNLYKTHPYRMSAATAGLLVAGFMTPFINALLASFSPGDDDDDWYWSLPQWVRRNNLIIGWKGTYIAIPLAVEQRAIYGLGDISAAFAAHKVANKRFWSVAFDVMNQAGGILPINPVEDYTSSGNVADAALRMAMPDATMVFLDWATNRDYTGRPLAKENPYNDNTPNIYGAYSSTPSGIVKACEKIAQLSGGHIDLKPGYIRDAFKQYGGGIYTAFEEASKFATGVIDPDKPMRVGDIPFISGFVGHIDEDRTDSFVRDALYDYQENMESVIKRIRIAAGDKDGDLSPKVIFEGEMPEGSASIQRIYEGRKYELAKMYREGMNGPDGVTKLRKAWNDAKEEYAKMPKGTAEEKQAREEQKLVIQDAWQKYYDAECNLVDKLLDYEYNKENK